MTKYAIGAAFVVCASICTLAFAQVNATVGGSVSDPTGAVLPGVEVTAKNVNTGIVSMTLTNETGSYDFPSLQPGTYTVSAALAGFQTRTFDNVRLSQGQQVRLNFTLQVGSVAQAVEVLTNAQTELATTTASVGDVLPDTEVRSLPLASRNVLDLIKASAGVVDNNFAGSRVSQINTTRDGLPTADGRYLDWNGAYSATFTSPDLVEEVQVTVNTVDAAVGRGSGQVRMQTRSGTNDFHGALFYQNQNSALSANSWFQNLVGAPKNYNNRNQFGGRLGGPIKQNKAFFFFLYDGQRYMEKVTVVSTVLTPPARAGIFRYLTANAPGGTSRRNGNAFSTTPSVDLAGNVLTSDHGTPLFLNQIDVFKDINDPNRRSIDPVWVAPQFLPRMPLPNDYTVGDGLNTAGIRWQRRDPGLDGATGDTQTTNRNNYNVRLDYQINANNKLAFTMTRESDWGVTGQTGLPDYPGGFFGDVKRYPEFYTASWAATMSPTVLNEFRWGLKRDTWLGTSAIDKGCCTQDGTYNLKNLVGSAQQAAATFPTVPTGQLLFINQTPGFGLGYYAPFVTAPRGAVSPLSQFADTLSWTKGSHAFQGGVELTFSGTNQWNLYGRPRVTLGEGNVPVPGVSSAHFSGLNPFDYGTVRNLLSNLAGTVSSASEYYGINYATDKDFFDYRKSEIFSRYFHENDWALYLKDNWKITRNLTLNLGLRYDKYGVPYDSHGLGVRAKGGQAGLFGISGKDFNALWNPYATGGSLTQMEFAGKDSPNPDKLIYGNQWTDFAPSIGFSWNLPWFARTTVLRGGYGINYTGAATFLQYSGNIGSAPGSSLSLTNPPPAYANLTSAPGIFPMSTGGIGPFQPVPLTNRNTSLVGYADNRAIPYVQSFNLSLQRELARNLTLEVSYIGNKGTKLWGVNELNETNIFENGILDAFNVTRAGGTAPLFDRIMNGLTVPGIGKVNGTTLTGSEALRRFTTTNQWIANGEPGRLANWFNSTNALTGVNGGLLRNGGLPENFIVVNPQFGSVGLWGNPDSSIYHSLHTELTKRLARGVTGQFAYTFSKNLGNSAGGNNFSGDTVADTRDPRNRHLQRGLIGFDHTHQLNAYGSWSLPFGPNQAFLAKAPSWIERVVEGWQTSGIFTWVSGDPLTFYAGNPIGFFTTTRDTLGSRAVYNTADLVGHLPKVGKVRERNGFVEYFAGLSTRPAPQPDFGGNASLKGRFSNQVVVDNGGNIILQNPRPGTTGNTALNLPGFVGPSHLGFDMALTKQIRIAEGKSFSIRADAINILNTPQWANPNTDINSANFGRITTIRDNASPFTNFHTTRTFTMDARIDF